jgi:hypothetical protein
MADILDVELHLPDGTGGPMSPCGTRTAGGDHRYRQSWAFALAV